MKIFVFWEILLWHSDTHTYCKIMFINLYNSQEMQTLMFFLVWVASLSSGVTKCDVINGARRHINNLVTCNVHSSTCFHETLRWYDTLCNSSGDIFSSLSSLYYETCYNGRNICHAGSPCLVYWGMPVIQVSVYTFPYIRSWLFNIPLSGNRSILRIRL